MPILFALVGLVAGIILGLGGWFAWKHYTERDWARKLSTVLLLVKLPKGGGENQSDTKSATAQEISHFEQLVSNLSSLKEPFTFEVAVPHVGEEIHFYIAIPRNNKQTVTKLIQGIWTSASVEEDTEDYNIFNPHGVTSAANVELKESFILPIRTYQELETDSFNAFLGAFSKINQIGEGASIQLVMRPASGAAKKSSKHALESLKKGEKLEKITKVGIDLGDVRDVLKNKEGDKESKGPVDEEALKAVSAKLDKPLFEVNVRILASAPTEFQANDILESLSSNFTQFASPRRNEFKISKIKKAEKVAYQFAFRSFDSSKAMILNSAEIASIYHFPTAALDAPKVKWLKSKEAAPPANMPVEGTLAGHSLFRGQNVPVYITDEDRRRHIYTIGQTGTGKSTFLQDLMMEDLRNGRGFAVIDPHGDLCEGILNKIPKERLDDIIYFDPGDLWRPLGMNMLDYNFNRPEEKTFIVNEMQSIFDQLFSKETMGPMFEQYMRNALLLLMEDLQNEPATLIEIPRVFTDTEYRKRKLARIHNPVVIDFWEKEAVKAGGEASLANMTPYITSKFNNFIANDYMRVIIGQPKSAFNFREVMDSGKILLVNLSKGKMGDINANLLGMIIIGKVLMAALSRVDIADQSQRKDFNLYIDEFQNFTTDAVATILSEARKYRLTLTMAHQFIGQLKENIRDAVFGNVGSMFVFRVGTQDAEFLEKQFTPVFDRKDLVNIDNFRCFSKILINNQTSQPFSMEIERNAHKPGNSDLAKKYKEYCRVKFGMDRDEIENGIRERLRA